MRPGAIVMAALVVCELTTPASGAQAPKAGALDARVTSVAYQENNVVRVSATYGISTMIVFDEDERFETISLGDSESWQVVPADKGNILFVKPIARNVATNMNVVTNRRIYFLELADSAPDSGRQVFGIRFSYPDKSLNAGLRQEAERRLAWPNIAGIDKANVNIDYSYSGDARLKPSLVFDDGHKTFFTFSGRVPAIFGVNSDFSETLKNFRKEGEYIVLDGVSTQFTLRDGDQWICIFNLRKPDFGAPDADVMAPARDVQAKIRRRSGN
ncbi:conjugal transfer protein TrbG [Mesorhizobium sp. B2-3-5]|nr:conjugal transfer protein TrbG [Mesorhizobium sp. B2-3-5]